MYPELIYNYDFLDTLTAEFYQTGETMLQLIQVFSFIALFIGCMGLTVWYPLWRYRKRNRSVSDLFRALLGHLWRASMPLKWKRSLVFKKPTPVCLFSVQREYARRNSENDAAGV